LTQIQKENESLQQQLAQEQEEKRANSQSKLENTKSDSCFLVAAQTCENSVNEKSRVSESESVQNSSASQQPKNGGKSGSILAPDISTSEPENMSTVLDYTIPTQLPDADCVQDASTENNSVCNNNITCSSTSSHGGTSQNNEACHVTNTSSAGNEVLKPDGSINKSSSALSHHESIDRPFLLLTDTSHMHSIDASTSTCTNDGVYLSPSVSPRTRKDNSSGACNHSPDVYCTNGHGFGDVSRPVNISDTVNGTDTFNVSRSFNGSDAVSGFDMSYTMADNTNILGRAGPGDESRFDILTLPDSSVNVSLVDVVCRTPDMPGNGSSVTGIDAGDGGAGLHLDNNRVTVCDASSRAGKPGGGNKNRVSGLLLSPREEKTGVPCEGRGRYVNVLCLCLRVMVFTHGLTRTNMNIRTTIHRHEGRKLGAADHLKVRDAA
jgi:hypothetical protein